MKRVIAAALLAGALILSVGVSFADEEFAPIQQGNPAAGPL